MAIGYGSRGEEVKSLQRQLNAMGASLKVDGIWGPKTQAAYKTYKTKSVPSAAITNTGQKVTALPKIEYMQYTPMTDAKKNSVAKAQIDPAYDSRLKELDEEYARSKQDNENEALNRGMSRSSYVLDVRSALDAHKADEKSTLEGERAAKIQALVEQLTQEDRDKEESARKYNNDIALQLETMRQKQIEAQRDYELQLKKLAVAQAKAKNSTSGASSSAKKASKASGKISTSKSSSGSSASVSYYDYYSKNYLQKYGNNPTVARVLYYSDRINLQKTLGAQAVKKLDAIADQMNKARSISAVLAR